MCGINQDGAQLNENNLMCQQKNKRKNLEGKCMKVNQTTLNFAFDLDKRTSLFCYVLYLRKVDLKS